jgi:predicted permease
VVALATGLKLVVLPALVFVLLLVFGVGGLAAAVCITYATLPGSAASYVMARQMGGDGPLMAAIIAATTLAAMVAMPLGLLLFA